MNLTTFCQSLIVVICLLASTHLYASRGITTDEAAPHFSGLYNQETVEDLRVKVLGGELRFNRVWRGKSWQWNERWANISPMIERFVQGNVQTKELAIYRAGQLYRKSSQTEDSIVYENQLTQFITKTAEKYVWTDRQGNGIEYDLDGRITAYFDKNKIYVYFERDTDGNIVRIKDHHQNIALTLNYEGYPNPDTKAVNSTLYRLTKLTDYSGRAVAYGWNAKGQLATVTDVRGQVWTYVYDTEELLIQLKDPDGRITRYEIEADGRFISRFNADGKGVRYQYNFDKEKGRYFAATTNGQGQVSETWYNGMGLVEESSEGGDPVVSTSYVLSNGSKDVKELMDLYSYRVEHWYRGNTFLYKVAICGAHQTPKDDGCVVTDPGLINAMLYVKFKKEVDAKGDVTTTEYNQWKQVVSVTYPNGARARTSFHPEFELPVTQTDENGRVTHHDYTEEGNLLTLIEAKGTDDERITRYTYDEFGQLKTKTTGESAANNTGLATISYEYDQYGNITKVTDAEGNVTRYSDYDALGNAKIITDARSNILPINEQYTWQTTYDNAGNVLTRRDPYGKGETYTYTKTGDLESMTSASGSTLTLTSNASGQPLTMTDGNNKATKLEYNKAGNLTFTTDANGNKTQTVYDAKGNVWRTVDGEGNTTQFNYANELLRSIEYPSYKELLEYDKRNNLKQTTQQANSRNYIRKRGYDLAGNLETSTDAQTKETVYGYDALNRVRTITDAEGGITEFTYDARDNLLQVKDPEGRLTIYTYDKNDRLLTETKDGDQNTNKQRRYGYDTNGNLTSRINPEHEKTTYEFDQANRLVKTLVFANKDHVHPIKVINYSFNEKNQLSGWNQQASINLPEGVAPTEDVISFSETNSYNNLGQLEFTVVNFGSFTKTYSYTYYPNGLKKTYTNPESITYTYYYNKNNQLMAVHIPGEGQISWANFEWMVPQTLLLPGGQKISLKYDDFQQMEERVLRKADNTELAKAVYEYDLEQNIKKIEKNEGTFTYNYDDLYRLTTADSPNGYAANDETFDYDGVGNRTSRTENGATENGTSESQNYNQKNQLQAIDSSDNTQDVTYTYNANGHTKTQTKNGVVTEYVYNHEERLIAVKRDGSVIADYAYNPHGQRVKKTANGTTTWYLYNENGLAAEYSSTGQLLKEYHFHPQKTWMTDPLFQRTIAGELYYYHNDHLGTPQQMVDTSGNVVWSAQYSAFGKAYIAINIAENNLRFPGQYYDNETGLHQNYRREYDSEIGRYIEADPIGFNGGINPFVYSISNSIKYIDPLGLSPSAIPGLPPPINPHDDPNIRPEVRPPEPLPPQPPRRNCETLYTLCVARCLKKPICKAPYFGKAAKAGCYAGCTLAWAICRSRIDGDEF